jgi:ATP-dependent DNA ligase
MPSPPDLDLPVRPPLEPMLAKAVTAVPERGEWLFEPKWDGFRVIVFRDGDEVYLQSRDKRPLARYFPELLPAVRGALPERVVLDGEIVVARDGRLDFEALQMRLHPAKSRVDKLSKEIPAELVLWDVLAVGSESLLEVPQRRRRERLVSLLPERAAAVHVTPATRDRAVAKEWFERFEGAGLDGIMAKPLDAPYQPKKRAMLKIKHVRTCDCVVAGFRWHKKGPGTLVGSLVLGLWDPAGELVHVGITSSFTMQKRAALVEELAPLRDRALEEHPWARWAEAAPKKGATQSRWNAGKDLSFEPLRLERVVEVKFDHLQGGRRFRHATTFQRWRPDKPVEACTFDQIEEPPVYDLESIWRGASPQD